MTDFNDIVFSTDFLYKSKIGTKLEKYETISVSNQRIQICNNIQFLVKCEIYPALFSNEQKNEFLNFYRAHKNIGFRFLDPFDYQARYQKLLPINKTKLQIVKNYVSGNAQEVRVISKPVINTIEIYNIDKQKINPSNYELDLMSGIITLTNTSIDINNLYANFDFHVPAKFDTEDLMFDFNNSKQFSTNNPVIITEIPPNLSCELLNAIYN